MSPRSRLDAVVALADSWVARSEPRMKWMWGEALVGYALLELDEVLGESRYLPFLTEYCTYWLARDPRVDQADTAAPALITYGVHKKLPERGFDQLTDKVLDYVRHSPRLLDDAVNHLGNSPEGWLYPRSIWVDSLMMFSVFPSRYAAETGDRELLDFAARQPRLYAGYMQHPVHKLWAHSYWVRLKTPWPRRGLYWGRGNGWVVAALPMILDHLPQDHPERPEILRILAQTSQALRPLQRADGYWETVLDRPGRTYRESSATALVAAGWMRAVRHGYLPESYRQPALMAFHALVDDLVREGDRVSMGEISAPTIPLPVLPYWGYKLVPRGKDWSYGVAALILAGLEHEALVEGSP